MVHFRYLRLHLGTETVSCSLLLLMARMNEDSKAICSWHGPCKIYLNNTAILRKVVGKSAPDNPERYCGCLWGHCSSKKFERMVREAPNICLRVLKESNKSRFDRFSRYEQCIDHIPYYLLGLSGVHFFWQPFTKQLYIKQTAGPGLQGWH